jgi:(2Fe-2S) ferredoxin
VCTHGVHDTCCALRGRPVAAALAEHWPDAVWECSHVGGDRFAPNVVVLPDGFYYGQLDPESAVATVRSHLTGTVAPRWLRGVAPHVPPVQAAVVGAYARFGPLAAGAVTVVDIRRDGPESGHGSTAVVALAVHGRPADERAHVLAVRRPAAQLTCRAGRETPATEYQVTWTRAAVTG